VLPGRCGFDLAQMPAESAVSDFKYQEDPFGLFAVTQQCSRVTRATVPVGSSERVLTGLWDATLAIGTGRVIKVFDLEKEGAVSAAVKGLCCLETCANGTFLGGVQSGDVYESRFSCRVNLRLGRRPEFRGL
jgi:hypothetical protein